MENVMPGLVGEGSSNEVVGELVMAAMPEVSSSALRTPAHSLYSRGSSLMRPMRVGPIHHGAQARIFSGGKQKRAF